MNNKNLASSEKNRIFAELDEEPTALATDIGKPIPILKGEDAIRFEKLARQAEQDYEKRKNAPKSLEQLQQQLQMEQMMYDFSLKQLKERENKITKIKNLIQEKVNGKKGQ